MDGILYVMDLDQPDEPLFCRVDRWVPPYVPEFHSPSESFSLYSFWLGRDSDALLEWPPEPTYDFTFAYLEQD